MLAFKALKGASWLVVSRLTGRVIDFVTLLILARMLTPADFGIAALATSLVFIVDVVLEVPVTQALVRLPEINKRHLDTGFTIGLLRSMAVATILLVLAWPFSLINKEPALVALVAVLTIGPFAKGLSSPAMVHFARGLVFRPTFLLETVGKLCSATVVVIVVFAGGSYWAIVANYATAAVCTTLLSYVFAPYKPSLSLSRLSDFAGFIGWYSGAQLISAINWQFDRFFVGLMLDKTTLGHYAVASDISFMPTQSVIGPAMQPIMAAFSRVAHDPERMQSAFLKAVRFVMLISIPVCLGISLTADLLTTVLLGPQWKEAAPLLSLLSLAMLPVPYFQTLYSACLAADRPVAIFRMNAIEFFVRTTLVLLGLYAYSIIGVSVAKIAAAALMSSIYLHEARRLLQIGIAAQLRNIWKIPLAGLSMSVIVLALRREIDGMALNVFIELGIVAAAGAAAYALTLLALGMRLITGGGRLEFTDNR